jgi:hypothetical protein
MYLRWIFVKILGGGSSLRSAVAALGFLNADGKMDYQGLMLRMNYLVSGQEPCICIIGILLLGKHLNSHSLNSLCFVFVVTQELQQYCLIVFCSGIDMENAR